MRGKEKTILIVDDSQVFRSLYRLAITRRYSCEILEAENGAEGLELLAKNTGIDLILLNLNMPEMNGIQFLETLRKDSNHHTPVIISSTEDMEEEIQKALSLGANGYVLKPFSPASLYSVIDSVLEK